MITCSCEPLSKKKQKIKIEKQKQLFQSQQNQKDAYHKQLEVKGLKGAWTHSCILFRQCFLFLSAIQQDAAVHRLPASQDEQVEVCKSLRESLSSIHVRQDSASFLCLLPTY